MNKKVILAYIVLIICILLLVASYTQWKDKLSSFGQQSPTTVSSPKPDTESDGVKESLKPEQAIEQLLTLTTHQDKQVQEVFRNRLKAGEKVNFLITGSSLMDYGEPGYAERLKTALVAAYGDYITVTAIGFDATSQQFTDKLAEEQIDLSIGYDVILFEPFTLNNNGLVAIEDGHAHINTFRTRLKEHVKDAVIVLHPPNPIYAATYYPAQVTALKSFAEAEGIPYVNHWTNWPDQATEEILSLLGDKSMPNSDGAEVWANTLITYFIAN
ncbi:SGNH/GDSL hydrolase family protein [Sporosarcina sp. E16_8]|uniref:SGNH/GDSL hydrolase family protein n=1 Tax=Sporosarcina sp. E16_8 TaxID=2789295 RepID=UPI001A934D89|nr:SGNH/GDSL hydrolase family protein [Sporosarcina sp. E16_8]MBO0589164.1 SGNH/GDSL hydrolase family protein [Sporosarcina sp. E16_8]